MPYIVQNLTALDLRLQLGAEELIRPISFGSQWGRIRIGVRLVFLYGNSSPSPQIGFTGGTFYGGVCVGSAGFSSPNCVDAVGCWYGGTTTPATQPWFYTFAAGAYGLVSTNSNPGVYYFRKTGSAITGTGAGGYLYTVAHPYASTNYCGAYWDITRTSPTSTTLDHWCSCASTAVAMANMTRANHISNMESEGTPTASGISYNHQGSTAITTTNAPWDTVFVGWQRSVPVIEIRDLMVLRFY